MLVEVIVKCRKSYQVMDPVSATASIIALIDSTYCLVEFLSDFKDGGKERMKLLAEVSNMACTLDSLERNWTKIFQPQGS
jgi:hypothetical protein